MVGIPILMDEAASMCLCHFLKRLSLFLEQFQVQSKIEGEVQRFPMFPLPPNRDSLPHINISHQGSIFVTLVPSLLPRVPSLPPVLSQVPKAKFRWFQASCSLTLTQWFKRSLSTVAAAMKPALE